MIKKQFETFFLKALENIEYGSLDLTTASGDSYHFKGRKKGPHAEMTIHVRGVIRNMVMRGDIGLAEDYRDGKWDSKFPEKLFHFGLLNSEVLDRFISGKSWFRFISKLGNKVVHRNTKSGSKKNIMSHYDLGNDFYSLWLDETMTYSSALFSSSKQPLKKAQINKYARIFDRIQGENKNILEIGCGWGGFAEYALDNGAKKVEGITISPAQKEYAQNRLEGKNADIIIEDYRDKKGHYDAIVSIEMFEAVGEEYWPVYFQQIKHLLKKGSKAMVQTITIDNDYFEHYRQGGDAIRTLIFPGGMLPSPNRFIEEAKKAGLNVSNQKAFGKDYAKTLMFWLKNFDKQKDVIIDLGFDEQFIRLWRFYLTSCAGAFLAGRTDVIQMELSHDD